MSAALFWLVASLVSAQVTTTSTASATLTAASTYTPAVPWTIPNGVCSQGSTATATGGYGGGVFEDVSGNFWEVECNYAWSGSSTYDVIPNANPPNSEDSDAQGIYACFNGCANRPGCVAFEFFGTTTGPHSGTGKCM